MLLVLLYVKITKGQGRLRCIFLSQSVAVISRRFCVHWRQLFDSPNRVKNLTKTMHWFIDLKMSLGNFPIKLIMGIPNMKELPCWQIFATNKENIFPLGFPSGNFFCKESTTFNFFVTIDPVRSLDLYNEQFLVF